MYIFLQISFVNIVVLVALTAATDLTATDKHYLHAERNESITFICSMSETTSCELYKYISSKALILRRSHNKEGRFSIKDTEFCVIEITNLKVYDAGEYHCITDREYKVYYLAVKGKPSVLLYNNIMWLNNSENMISNNQQGLITFKCHSYLPKRESGRTTFVWMLDKKHVKTDTLPSKMNDDLWESESSIQILFKHGHKEKFIKCQIISGKQTEVLTGIFGIPYRTSKVRLIDKSRIKERTILNGDLKEIACKANGFPTPKDILIKRKMKNNMWETVASQSFFKVSESGMYTCEARNTNANGTEMGFYIRSNRLIFRNYG